MQYLLALGAIALPAYLLAQVIRGKVRPQCCAGATAQPIDAGEASPADRPSSRSW